MKIIAGVLLAATLAFASGCAKTDWIDRTLVTETVTGVWAGSMVSPGGQPAVNQDVGFDLQQQGPRVVGAFRGGLAAGSFGGSIPIEGRVAGDVFTFNDSRGLLTGELTIDGEEMKGRGIVGNSRPVTFNLRRIDASPPPISPTR